MPDLRTLPLERFCAFVWYVLTKGADEQAKEKFKAVLWRPPVGEVGQGPWSSEAETSAFAAFKAASAGAAS